MIARLAFENSALALLRATGLAISAFVGAWDVGRLLSGGDRPPDTLDLVTCPILPVMQAVAAHVAVTDNILAWTLFLGNAATYGAVGYFLVRLLVQRISGEVPRVADAS